MNWRKPWHNWKKPLGTINRYLKTTLRITGYFFIALFSVLIIFLTLSYRTEIPVAELEPQYFTKESMYIQVGDATLHVRKCGTGPYLFLIHGSFSSLHTWERWEDILGHSFTTISLDLPGHGLTGPNKNQNYSTDYYADLIFALADTLKVDTFYVAGNSLGGMVAWKMALHNPDRVKKLILVDAAGYEKSLTGSVTKRPFIFRMLEIKPLALLLTKVTPRFLLKMNLKDVYGDPEKFTDKELDRYYELMRREGNREATLKRLQHYGRNLQDSIKFIQVPSLILWGQKDRWIQAENAYRFHNDIGSSHVIVFPHAGHIPMEEVPEKSADAAMNFLQEK
jgi:pimeloyl-ACP methyl ester carboxylesterase